MEYEDEEENDSDSDRKIVIGNKGREMIKHILELIRPWEVRKEGLVKVTYRGNLPRVPRATGYDPKVLYTISSLWWHTTGEQYTLYRETTPPLQAEEAGPPS
jgi:hypothetical protein